MVDACPELWLSLVKLNLLSEPLLRLGWHQVFMKFYGQYKCTAASLGIVKMKKLLKMMKQVKMIKQLTMRLRNVSVSPCRT